MCVCVYIYIYMSPTYFPSFSPPPFSHLAEALFLLSLPPSRLTPSFSLNHQNVTLILLESNMQVIILDPQHTMNLQQALNSLILPSMPHDPSFLLFSWAANLLNW